MVDWYQIGQRTKTEEHIILMVVVGGSDVRKLTQ